jgi:hypothetical protein
MRKNPRGRTASSAALARLQRVAAVFAGSCCVEAHASTGSIAINLLLLTTKEALSPVLRRILKEECKGRKPTAHQRQLGD